MSTQKLYHRIFIFQIPYSMIEVWTWPDVFCRGQVLADGIVFGLALQNLTKLADSLPFKLRWVNVFIKNDKIEGIFEKFSSQKHTIWLPNWQNLGFELDLAREYICLVDVWTWFKFNHTVQISEYPSNYIDTLETLVLFGTGSRLFLKTHYMRPGGVLGLKDA